MLNSCKNCKYNNCKITISIITNRLLYHTNICKITKKEKADNDCCKRYKYKLIIAA